MSWLIRYRYYPLKFCRGSYLAPHSIMTCTRPENSVFMARNRLYSAQTGPKQSRINFKTCNIHVNMLWNVVITKYNVLIRDDDYYTCQVKNVRHVIPKIPSLCKNPWKDMSDTPVKPPQRRLTQNHIPQPDPQILSKVFPAWKAKVQSGPSHSEKNGLWFTCISWKMNKMPLFGGQVQKLWIKMLMCSQIEWRIGKLWQDEILLLSSSKNQPFTTLH